MKKRYLILFGCLLAVVIIVVVAGVGMSRLSGRDPVQEEVWTGRPGNLAQWGHTEGFIYGVLSVQKPESSDSRDYDDILVLRKWKEGTFKDVEEYALPDCLRPVPAVDGIWGLSIAREKGSWPFCLLRVEDGKVLREWDVPKGWSIV
ncbi:MAG: hypothetical protein ACP5HU_13500, partial [Phycisphaerae bacterium]